MNVDFHNNGKVTQIKVAHVWPDDQAFFAKHDIKISMETLQGQQVVYADIGMKNVDGEPDELIELEAGRSCYEVLHALRLQCQKYLPKE